jgi:glycosyltransferase involved in cell wall biosynthesis
MKKRLVIDARWLQTGIGRYVINLLDTLRQHRNGFAVHAIVRRKDASWLRPFCDEVTVVDLPIYGWREQMSIPWAARSADLLHVPHYNVPLLFRGNLLVTIHDLIHILDPAIAHQLTSRLYARPMLKFAARRARRIVTVSQYSKAQIVQQLGVHPEKVIVIYNGVHPRFHCQDLHEARKGVDRAFSLDRPYLLYVGNLKRHKNLPCLLRGFALLCSRGRTDHHLLIIGNNTKERRPLQEACAQLGIATRVRFISYVNDELLPKVYAAADLLILPSLMEGFGFPMVEAMACGTPVVCSRSAALPEIGGDAAEFFDPSSFEDLATAMRRILESSELQKTLRQKGLERAKLFSWEQCGWNHYRSYQETLEA